MTFAELQGTFYCYTINSGKEGGVAMDVDPTTQTRVTMHDVANAAGVSQATVSLVMSGKAHTRVSPKTVQRVKDAAHELGFRTNAFARSLRSGQSGMIGFISDEVATSQFAGKLLKGAQLRAWETGLVILSVDTFGDPALTTAAIELMQSYRVAGTVLASMYHRQVEVPEALADSRVVVLNAQDSAEITPSVFPDEERGGFEATTALIKAGHTSIGMINIQSPDSTLPAGVGRLAGYRRALEAHGLSYDPRLVLHGDGVVADGAQGTAHLLDLDSAPTAVFCGNDRTAWGAYRTVALRGLRVGEDLSLIGFDDQEAIAPDLNPTLTTMALPFEAMGSHAIDLLQTPDRTTTLHAHTCRLITRESVTKAKAHA